MYTSQRSKIKKFFFITFFTTNFILSTLSNRYSVTPNIDKMNYNCNQNYLSDIESWKNAHRIDKSTQIINLIFYKEMYVLFKVVININSTCHLVGDMTTGDSLLFYLSTVFIIYFVYGGPLNSLMNILCGNNNHDDDDNHDYDMITLQQSNYIKDKITVVNYVPDLEKIEKIEEFKEDDVSKQDCCICLEQYDLDVQLGVLQCSHKFHYNCIHTWLHTNMCCPVCRAPV